jgi:hypothetical protein
MRSSTVEEDVSVMKTFFLSARRLLAAIRRGLRQMKYPPPAPKADRGRGGGKRAIASQRTRYSCGPGE